jgi:hypothetical protein
MVAPSQSATRSGCTCPNRPSVELKAPVPDSSRVTRHSETEPCAPHSGIPPDVSGYRKVGHEVAEERPGNASFLEGGRCASDSRDLNRHARVQGEIPTFTDYRIAGERSCGLLLASRPRIAAELRFPSYCTKHAPEVSAANFGDLR